MIYNAPLSRLGLVAFVVVVDLLFRDGGGVSAQFPGPIPPKTKKVLNIVAIGDSYISGTGQRDFETGEPDYVDDNANLCYESPKSWAALYSSLLRDMNKIQTSLTMAACAGATLLAPGTIAQLDSLNQDADLVLISISGNDFGFVNALIACYALYNGKLCRERLKDAEDMANQIRLSLQNFLVGVRRRVRKGTKIVLVGYPYLSLDVELFIPENTFSGGLYPYAQEIRRVGDIVEKAQAQAVKNVNGNDSIVQFVSTKDIFSEREVHPSPFKSNDRAAFWEVNVLNIAGTFPGDINELFHYARAGHGLLAAKLWATYGDFDATREIKPGLPGSPRVRDPPPLQFTDKDVRNGNNKLLEKIPPTAPLVRIITASPSGKKNKAIAIKGEAGDLNGPDDIQEIQWFLVNVGNKMKPKCMIEQPTSLSTMIKCSESGTYTVGLRVWDKAGLEGNAEEVEVRVT